ncbi:hypothetical protein JYU12_00605 [bacterium AH-315-K03]|nr:hypothetical protein [bacterium AH-315-K03]
MDNFTTNGSRPLNAKGAISFISVDNYDFNKKYINQLLSFFETNYVAAKIIIADELIVYNKYNPMDFSKSEKIIKEYSRDAFRMVSNVVESNGCFKNISLSRWGDYCTGDFFDFLRRCYLLMTTDKGVSIAIDERVKTIINKNTGSMSNNETHHLSVACKAYVIEETAMSIFTSSIFELDDEYYPNDTAPVLMKTYELINKIGCAESLKLKPHSKRFWSTQINTEDNLERELIWEVHL